MIEPSRLKKSFVHAARGIRTVFKEEQSFRIQVVIATLVLILAVFFELRMTEFIVIILLIAMVLGLELINSIFERIVDTFKPRIHPAVRDIKDIMAGAVLIASVTSAIIGLIIFWPKIAPLF